jgi:L-alanine-DL-glutamate epimerase-like enolase superfamily enzyme
MGETVRIISVESVSFNYRTSGRFKFFEGPDGKPTGRPSVLVKLTNEDGVEGWGQSVPVPKWSYETPESVISTIDLYLAPVLLQNPIGGLEELHELMDTTIAGSFSTGMPIAKAGIDLAFHDLLGKVNGCSLPQLWGRVPQETVELSWTLNPLSLDDLEPLIEEGREKGYRNFNVKVAPDLKFDRELCTQVKRMVPEGFLWADANGGYTLDTALEAAPLLADVGVAVLEQPLKPNQLRGYRTLKKQGALPIIMDEGVVSPTDLVEFVALDLLDGVAMKPARCGGLWSARRQIEFLRDAGLMFLGSGLTDPDFSLAASLMLYGAFNYSLPAALNGPQFLVDSVLTTPFQVQAGRLPLPEGPGLGVELDPEKLPRL